MKKIFAVLLIILIIPVSLHAADFGLLLNQGISYGNSDTGDNELKFQTGLVPRFFTPIGKNCKLFISAMFTIEYMDPFIFIPELMRTEFTLANNKWEIKAGRINYKDPLSLIAQGLFDGLQFNYTSSFGRIGVGGYYTGFLYKKTANIVMTPDDKDLYDLEFDFKDFVNTYFAPKRVLASLDWEHPSIKDVLQLNIGIIGQYELTDNNQNYNSLYAFLKTGIPIKRFLLELGGSISGIQHKSAADTKYNLSFAANGGIIWLLPTSFASRISLTGSYASGQLNETFEAFNPVTTRYIGQIFQTKTTALTALSFEFASRISRAFGINLTALYFIRNDQVTGEFPISGNQKDGDFLGLEAYGSIIWSPFSDLQLNLNGGAFFPNLGNVWSDADIKWKLGFTAVLSLY